MAISDDPNGKRFAVECHVFDGMGEDDTYTIYTDTIEEAASVAADEQEEEDEDGHCVIPEIIDRWWGGRPHKVNFTVKEE